MPKLRFKRQPQIVYGGRAEEGAWYARDWHLTLPFGQRGDFMVCYTDHDHSVLRSSTKNIWEYHRRSGADYVLGASGVIPLPSHLSTAVKFWHMARLSDDLAICAMSIWFRSPATPHRGVGAYAVRVSDGQLQFSNLVEVVSPSPSGTPGSTDSTAVVPLSATQAAFFFDILDGPSSSGIHYSIITYQDGVLSASAPVRLFTDVWDAVGHRVRSAIRVGSEIVLYVQKTEEPNGDFGDRFESRIIQTYTFNGTNLQAKASHLLIREQHLFDGEHLEITDLLSGRGGMLLPGPGGGIYIAEEREQVWYGQVDIYHGRTEVVYVALGNTITVSDWVPIPHDNPDWSPDSWSRPTLLSSAHGMAMPGPPAVAYLGMWDGYWSEGWTEYWESSFWITITGTTPTIVKQPLPDFLAMMSGFVAESRNGVMAVRERPSLGEDTGPITWWSVSGGEDPFLIGDIVEQRVRFWRPRA